MLSVSYFIVLILDKDIIYLVEEVNMLYIISGVYILSIIIHEVTSIIEKYIVNKKCKLIDISLKPENHDGILMNDSEVASLNKKLINNNKIKTGDLDYYDKYLVCKYSKKNKNFKSEKFYIIASFAKIMALFFLSRVLS